ncbi:uncharacterized protein EI97DRAFT_12969 [Westerdykella ornata]|uniref:Uncharacterized protein n=1 Tax=Westerdykella ornata TaxID=318751 RepID=A0A6A6JXI4_WESOR|nr:uncharacterized protein EI97DRAFT_12969 [Westerdykella ornata]KAF2280904.1 hypothetical protein EI97DRAFT_12969 [Westerdykella ornata]
MSSFPSMLPLLHALTIPSPSVQYCGHNDDDTLIFLSSPVSQQPEEHGQNQSKKGESFSGLGSPTNFFLFDYFPLKKFGRPSRARDGVRHPADWARDLQAAQRKHAAKEMNYRIPRPCC